MTLRSLVLGFMIVAATLHGCDSEQTSVQHAETELQQELTVEPPARSAVGAYAIQGARPVDVEPLPIANAGGEGDAGRPATQQPRSGVAL